MGITYRWHSSLALETSPHSIIDAFGLSPARVHTLEPITLVSVKVLVACVTICQ